MADPKGFLKTQERELPPRRPVSVRLMDWKEVYEDQDRRQLRRQAGRCMDCGVPFCHQGCPLGNLIPEWNDLTWRGEGRQAIERLHATNNFPEFTGRLCPAPCESSCVLGINQPPVTIKQVEVSIIDQAFANGWVQPHPPERLTGKTVAVVGSGPAGLAAAQQLTRAGHTVAVYERDDRIGGLLRYGIPDFKMEKKQLEQRLAQMQAEGTRFRAGVEIGVDITWDELRARYDAVVVATGATVPRDLPIPGRDLLGVHFAMDYLVQQNKVVAGDRVPEQISARRQARRRPRRRRHRRRLHRHRAPPGGAQRHQPRDRPAAARRAPRPPAVADVADAVRGLERARGGRRADVPRLDRRVPRRTTPARCARSASPRPSTSTAAACRSPAPSARSPPTSCCSRSASPARSSDRLDEQLGCRSTGAAT